MRPGPGNVRQMQGRFGGRENNRSRIGFMEWYRYVLGLYGEAIMYGVRILLEGKLLRGSPVHRGYNSVGSMESNIQ